MDLIKCPRCGEMYSSSYRRCPFCEEEESPRRVSRRGGHHVSEKKHTHSARGPILAVLLVVLVILSWYLFGGKFMERLQDRQKDPVEDVDPTPSNPDTNDPAAEPTDDPAVTPDDPTPPVVEPDPATPSEPSTVDVSSLSMKTNVGSLSKDTATGKYDCTIKLSESVRLIVQGTDAQVTWTSGDTSVVTVGTDGTLHPLKAGTTTITAIVGGASLECIIRVK